MLSSSDIGVTLSCLPGEHNTVISNEYLRGGHDNLTTKTDNENIESPKHGFPEASPLNDNVW